MDVQEKITNQKTDLSDFYNKARIAFYWTSFEPDRRATSCIKEHEELLSKDLNEIPIDEQERYIIKFREYFGKWLSAHANCASSAVTGGSGFNTTKAQKANDREHRIYGEFLEWREKTIKAIKRNIEKNKPEEQKQLESWESLKNSIDNSVSTVYGIKNGEINGTSKELIIANMYNRVLTFAKNGNIDIVDKAVALMNEYNKQKIVITERHAFFRLPDLARETVSKRAEQAKETKIQHFEGGKIVHNYEINRIQIFFDEIPSPQMRALLKKEFSFNWSGKNKAWQRILTTNALYILNQKIIGNIIFLTETNN